MNRSNRPLLVACGCFQEGIDRRRGDAYVIDWFPFGCNLMLMPPLEITTMTCHEFLHTTFALKATGGLAFLWLSTKRNVCCKRPLQIGF
jgi:hypothetical protein